MGIDHEEWRIIPAAPNYAASSLGRIRRQTPGPGTFPGRIKKQSLHKRDGYPVVGIVHNDGTRRVYVVHILVCAAFNGPKPSEQHEVAHEDGDKLNCAAANLSWKLPLENTHDKYRHGTMPMGLDHWKGIISDDDVRYIRRSGERHVDLARKHGVSPNWIWMIRAGRARKYVV